VLVAFTERQPESESTSCPRIRITLIERRHID
jgi:hypothetical protein